MQTIDGNHDNVKSTPVDIALKTNGYGDGLLFHMDIGSYEDNLSMIQALLDRTKLIRGRLVIVK